MATNTYSSTPETTNSNRASRILLGPCTDQLRDLLRNRISPANFHHVVTSNRSNLPRLTQPQRDLILPRSGRYSGDYSDMDISLLYLLLRNICNIQPHSNQWGNAPDISDNSLSASIDRIREARNKVVHSSSTTLTQTEFSDLLSEIKMAVVSIDSYLSNNKQYEYGMNFLLKETMDPELDAFTKQLKKQVDDDQLTKEKVAKLEEHVHDEISTLNTGVQKLDSGMERLHKGVQRNTRDIENIKRQFHEKQVHQRNRFLEILHSILTVFGIMWLIQLLWHMEENEPDVNTLKQRMIEINEMETKEIPLSPLQSDCDKLPIEQLFSSVVIKEDTKDNHTGDMYLQDGKLPHRTQVKSPEDLMTKNGKPVPRVYMIGKAAHGKTTYCNWLLKTWCNTQKPYDDGRGMNKWESFLSQFHFVFLISLRHVDTIRDNIIDMICQDILGTDTSLQTAAKHVLSCDKYRCFIMIDGLDEWKPDQSVMERLKYKGMPNIGNISNCVIFTTMRPWKFSEIAGVIRCDDRVIEILGLDDEGIESVTEKVLAHYYQMKPGTAKYETKRQEIISKLDNETLNSFIKIPLLAVVCVQIWCEGEQVGNSITSFYIAMVDMLIQRAHLKHVTGKLSFEEISVDLPPLFSSKKNIKNCFPVLLKLGKVAYEGLVSQELKLVFLKNDLETEMGKEELEWALLIGLVSQRDVHSVIEEKVSVHFFHKSVQELLAAIYIVNSKEVSDVFCEHLCNIWVIMDLSNVIMFVCGICPSLGSNISQCFVRVTNTDTKICQYRQSPGYGYSTLIELYKLQISWYRELQYRQRDTSATDSPVKFHVSDIYLLYDSDNETVSLTRKLLSDPNVDIMSLRLDRVSTNREHGITNKVLNDFLCNAQRTKSLRMVHIHGMETGRSVNIICGPALTLLHLWDVTIPNTDVTVQVPLLSDCDQLQRLYLESVSLGNRDLGLAPGMSVLQEVELQWVNMTVEGWGRLLQSVIDNHHQFVVTLCDTNLDRHTRSTIRSSPHLSVTLDDNIRLKFTRVWPLAKDT